MSETDPAKMLTDSPEGIAYLFRWAKAHGAVLYPVHAEIARKHGVSTDGVIIAGPVRYMTLEEQKLLVGDENVELENRRHRTARRYLDIAARAECGRGTDGPGRGRMVPTSGQGAWMVRQW